jgi:hypothetical protein
MESKLSASVSIHRNNNFSAQQLNLLKNTQWGTPGKTLYQHLDTTKTLGKVISPLFFNLERHGKILCTVCLSGRKVNIQREKLESNYVCYLASHSSIKGKGTRKKAAREKRSNGIIKTFMREVFQGSISQSQLHPENKKSLYYAYVESDNDQSLHLCTAFGFRSVRKLTTLAFSRFSPKPFANVRKAVAPEYDQLREAIAQQYSDHNFLCMEYIFNDGNYFVAEVDGKIVAGVQANPIGWSFKNLPGISGKILLKILPHVPYLNRLINPSKFEFSAFEGIFCLKGYEKQLNGLFESVLYHQQRNTALIWLDTDCPMMHTLRKHVKLGLMDVINSNGSGEIIVKGEGLTTFDWDLLGRKPMYISCFDMN